MALLGSYRKFTNEDHLMVHLQRHQMSLTLTAGNGNKLLFQDQTPTPTKFLKNCEEIGLFNDIKNPFDDAFSKAVTEGKSKLPSTPSNESPSLLGVVSEPDTLNTPTPHIQNDTPLKKRYRRFESMEPAPEFVPLPTSMDELDSAVNGAKNASDFRPTETSNKREVPVVKAVEPAEKRMKREVDERISVSSASSENPASQESVTQELSMEDVRQSSFDQDVSSHSYPRDPREHILSPAGNVHRISHDSLMSHDALMSPPGSVQSIPRDAVLSPAQQPDVRDIKSEYLASRPETVKNLEQAGSMETDLIAANTPLNLSSAGSTPTEAKIAMKPIAPQPAVLNTELSQLIQNVNQASGNQPYLLQVMVQTPEGKLMPVHIPAAIANTITDTAATGTLPIATSIPSLVADNGTVATTNGYVATTATALPNLATVPGSLETRNDSLATAANTNVKGNMQQLLLSSTVAVTSTTGSANASSFAKQKIKQRLLQSQNLNSPTGGGSIPSVTEALDHVTSQPSHAQARRDSWLSRDSSQSSFEVEYQDADSTYKNSGGVFSKMTPESDGDEKRRKFLERNRAAAARCRNKKKQWVTNLERKAEELQATNTKLQNEVTQLKAEMVQLKSLLLAHKDCPITLQQRQSGQLQLYSGNSVDAVSLPRSSESQSKQSTKLVTLAPANSANNTVSVTTLLTNKNELSTNSVLRHQDGDQWASTGPVNILPAPPQNVLANNTTFAIDLTKLNQS